MLRVNISHCVKRDRTCLASTWLVMSWKALLLLISCVRRKRLMTCELAKNNLYCRSPASKIPSILSHTVSLDRSVTDSSQANLNSALVADHASKDVSLSVPASMLRECQKSAEAVSIELDRLYGNVKRVQKLSALRLTGCQKQQLRMSVCTDHHVPFSTTALIAQAAL